jgi:hypothetical protein
MAGYDESKDILVREVGAFDTDNGQIRVGLFRYNNGPLKVGIQRVGVRKSGEEWTRSLGRITLDEAQKLTVLLKKATEDASE